MTTRNWTGPSTVNGGSYAFNPLSDILNFNSTSFHAAKVVLTDVGADLSVSTNGKTITLLGMSISKVTTTNFAFADQSHVMVGTIAAETINGGPYGDLIYGQGANDTVNGNGGTDYLYGGVGADRLDGGAGVDTMVGGAGNDIYIVDSTADVIY